MAKLAVLHSSEAQLGFKRHASAVLKSNLIQSIYFGTAVYIRSTAFKTGVIGVRTLSQV